MKELIETKLAELWERDVLTALDAKPYAARGVRFEPPTDIGIDWVFDPRARWTGAACPSSITGQTRLHVGPNAGIIPTREKEIAYRVLHHPLR